MPVEFIGMIGTKPGSETLRTDGPIIDPEYTRRFARAHEDAGFDRILIGYGSGFPEGSQVAGRSSPGWSSFGLLRRAPCAPRAARRRPPGPAADWVWSPWFASGPR